MAAVTIVEGALEGLQLLSNLLAAANTVNAAILEAQTSGKPVDWTSILGDEGTAEAAVLAAIETAKAQGR